MTRLWLLCFLLAPAVLYGPGNPDYRKVFGNDYAWAVNWLKQNDVAISKYATQFHIEPKLLKAIVFPELVRYNSLLNTMEVETLKYLYVNEGKHYANFSVGYFQMKPSFAENVERDVRRLSKEIIEKLAWAPSSDENEDTRKQRVRRLSNTHEQLKYLCAFYLICADKFNTDNLSSKEDIVRLLATCYNAGYHHNLQSLKAYREKKQFSGYNYSAVSWYYYTKEQ
jgi:hypothetical protein